LEAVLDQGHVDLGSLTDLAHRCLPSGALDEQVVRRLEKLFRRLVGAASGHGPMMIEPDLTFN
jgi:hypothetical protein